MANAITELKIRSQLLPCISAASHSLIPYHWKGEGVNWTPAIQNWFCCVAVDHTDFVAKILGVNTLLLFTICSYTFHVIPLGIKYRISTYTVMLLTVAQLYWVCFWLYTYYRILLLLLGLVFILLCRTYFYVHTDFVTQISHIQSQTFNPSKYFVLADWHTLYIICR